MSIFLFLDARQLGAFDGIICDDSMDRSSTGSGRKWGIERDLETKMGFSENYAQI
jgi:hypothetical protein